MESVLASLREARDALRAGTRGAHALKSVEAAMLILETTGDKELWKVNMSQALEERERRQSFASSTMEKDEGIRRWLIELVSPEDRDDDTKSMNTYETSSEDSSVMSGSFRAVDTSHDAQRMLIDLNWTWDVDVFDELSGGNSLSMLFTHLG
jgi:hypothetical protein